MKKRAFSQVYSLNEGGGYLGALVISEKLVQDAESILKEKGSIFHNSVFEPKSYVLGGSVAEINLSRHETVDNDWCLKIHSDSEKGLTELTGKLGLPLKKV